MPDLLFELGTEELPARFVAPALADLEKTFRDACNRFHFTVGVVRQFGTPRRLALYAEALPTFSDRHRAEVLGPAVKAAIAEDGSWKIPAQKFAASVKLPVESLTRVQTPKGEYLAAILEEEEKPVLELLPQVLEACIKTLSFPKSMRWGDVEQAFARPLQWIVALLDENVVPVKFADVQSGRSTRGHRFLAPQPSSLEKAADYEQALEQLQVIPSLEKRRALLVTRLHAAAKAAGGALLPDPDLVDQVLNLVELPEPLPGEFEPAYLDLPREALIQVMKVHQRYFCVCDEAGRLMSRFIAVSNTPVKDVALSVKGYERVLRARLSDARFFFEEDLKVPLEQRLLKLRRRQWIQGLGSMEEKTNRIGELATVLASKVGLEHLQPLVSRAAHLSKCDLETGMVSELPELQGVIGCDYARRQGEPEAVCLALAEHYLPKFAGDALPGEDVGALVGLADRIDSLCALFAIGKKPTGTKDEYALRRAAIGLIHIVLARGYRFSLGELMDKSLALVSKRLSEVKNAASPSVVRQQVGDFIRERLRTVWSEDYPANAIDAVLAVGADDLVAAKARLEALAEYVGKTEFAALTGTIKRVTNISGKHRTQSAPIAVQAQFFEHPEEEALYQVITATKTNVKLALETDNYRAVLDQLLTLTPAVDAFFKQVMVMSDNPDQRANRLQLLIELSQLFETIADFSRL